MRYEYDTVYIDNYDPGDALTSDQDAMLLTELNAAGGEGWEAFATVGDTVLLRRPLPEAGGPYRASASPPGTWTVPVEAMPAIPVAADPAAAARAIAVALERWFDDRVLNMGVGGRSNLHAVDSHAELVAALAAALGGTSAP